MKTTCKIKEFLLDAIRGVCIGVAFIIPGFSGGSVAAILGIYEKLVDAIADIFKDFKKSVLTLAPILIGMICAYSPAFVGSFRISVPNGMLVRRSCDRRITVGYR